MTLGEPAVSTIVMGGMQPGGVNERTGHRFGNACLRVARPPDSLPVCRRGRFARACDKASPAAAVMLHLRSCYVSKAAILTLSVLSVPVENRSPA